jgi:flap endonuclease-1
MLLMVNIQNKCMGIKNFSTLLGKVPNSVSKVTYNDFSGQTWAIDASIFFYRFVHNAQSKKPNSHLDGFYQLFNRLLKAKIRPLLICDGLSPIEKSETLIERAQQKQRCIDKVQSLQQDIIDLKNLSPEQVKKEQIEDKIKQLEKAEKNIIQFQPSVYTDVQHLCELMDIPMIRAVGEADALCAKLYLQGLVQAVMSEDSDMLLYGVRRLIRKFNWRGELEVINLDTMLSGFGISQDQFIDLSILCGTDYTQSTIKGLGPVSALSYIQKGFTIEQIIDDLSQVSNGTFTIPTVDNFPYQKVRNLIRNATQQEPNVVVEPFDLNKVNLDILIQFMSDKCRYRCQTIQGHMDQLKEIYTSQPKQKIKITLKKKV